MITTGIQQCLSILTDMDVNTEGKKVLIEQPTYHCFIDYLKLNGLEVEVIERTFLGIDLNVLEEIFQKGEIKFFYTMPRVHNPLGTGLTQVEKRGIVDLAYKYNVLIVEDDYMADYITDKSNDPLYTYDLERTHVVYLRSFSKSIFPGLRVGFAILPKALLKTFSEKKYYRDMGTSLLSQASLDVYLRNKMYDKHMSRMIRLYKQRARLMRTVLSELHVKGSFDINPESAIIHTCLNIGKHISIAKLERNNIKVADTKRYYYLWNRNINNYLLVNVSNMAEDQIREGIKKNLSK